MKPNLFFCLLAFCLTLAACAQQPAEPQPPEIIYGQDLCDNCGMIISEAKYAAATLLVEGGSHKFDDISDMVIYHLDHPNEVVKAWFVHDYNSEAWIRGETATYVRGDINTPMGGGIVAFENKAEAESVAAEVNGKVMNFDEMRVEVHVVIHGQ